MALCRSSQRASWVSVFQQIVDVSGDAVFPTMPQVVIPFEPKSIAIFNEDIEDGDDIFVSFDGVVDMGHLFAGNVRHYEQRTPRVWLRRGVVGTTPTNVQVLAEV